jgi:SAM-dependent methyltransferase
MAATQRVLKLSIANRIPDAELEKRAREVEAAAKGKDIPFAESAEWNKYPILDALQELGFAAGETKSAQAIATVPRSVLEIGAGTAQHGAFLAAHMSALWQSTERAEELRVLTAGVNHYGDFYKIKLPPPVELDVGSAESWTNLRSRVPGLSDMVYTSNTLHIMPWEAAHSLLSSVHTVMQPKGWLVVYGPFNYEGKFTTESNERFDGWLKSRNPHSGIRHFEEVVKVAAKAHCELRADLSMPDNNRLLVFQRD